jgi:hypothetical protein
LDPRKAQPVPPHITQDEERAQEGDLVASKPAPVQPFKLWEWPHLGFLFLNPTAHTHSINFLQFCSTFFNGCAIFFWHAACDQQRGMHSVLAEGAEYRVQISFVPASTGATNFDEGYIDFNK